MGSRSFGKIYLGRRQGKKLGDKRLHYICNNFMIVKRQEKRMEKKSSFFFV